MNSFYQPFLLILAPEIILVLAAALVLFFDLGIFRDKEPGVRWLISGMVVLFGCIFAGLFLSSAESSLLYGTLVTNSTVAAVQRVILLLTAITVVLARESRFTKHIGEYLVLIILASIGMLLMVSTENLLMAFIAIELTSLSLYTLAGFDKSSPASAEASLKYFLFGGFAAACLLFGMSFLYGMTGHIGSNEIAASLIGIPFNPIIAASIVLIIVGFGYKIAAAPFHLWAPDAYQGAPTISAAFIASASKVAGLFFFAKLFMYGMSPVAGNAQLSDIVAGWFPVLAVISAASIILGNVAALIQKSVKRLLAYSAIAHAGYMLLGVMVVGPRGLEPVLYYVVTYAVATIGAFGVIAIVEKNTGSDKLPSWAGLVRRSPFLAVAMLVFMLSLAGIPPLAGFFGKFYVFAACLSDGTRNLSLIGLVTLAILMSAVSLYYYLIILKQILVVPGENENAMDIRGSTKLILGLCAALTILLGAFPEWLFAFLR